jgi:type IV pilus assembly protein PilW
MSRMRPTSNLRKSAGLSLPEILVGLAIGLITMLVIMQVMSMARANQRVTTSAADTLVNAALGLYTIEREARNAGYGLSSVRTSLGCEVRGKRGAAAASNFVLTPVQITDAAGGAPDTVQFMSSARVGVTLPTRISIDHAVADPALFVESDLGVQTGDIMIAVPQTLSAGVPATTWCSLFEVAGTPSGPNQVPKMIGANSWNPDVANSVFPATGYSAGDYLINLGSFTRNTYSINNRVLRLNRFVATTNGSTDSDLYNDIVQLQAVYGRDTTLPADGVVDVWNATAPTSAAEWQQVRAIRMALVARGALETANVTLDGAQAASTCNSSTPHPAALCWRPDPGGNGVKIDVNIGNATPNWQRYRYRVFESTIALRNTIWQQ